MERKFYEKKLNLPKFKNEGAKRDFWNKIDLHETIHRKRRIGALLARSLFP